MSNVTKVLLGVAIALLMTGVATCHFGVQHATAQIPEEQRRQMADFDWIGSEWIARGLVIAILSVVLGVAGSVSLWRDRSRNRVTSIVEAS